MDFLTSLILCLIISSTSQHSQATTPSGTIERSTKQLILASIPPKKGEISQPFITSPSGKYIGYFVRSKTAPAAGGFGNDFCYIQIQDDKSGESLWESECAPVSEANTCTLVFDNAGLEVFDGSYVAWGTAAASADDNALQTLELVDEGDMWIRDKIGELAWKASQTPRANQGCGLPGSPGLAPVLPPFAQPIGGSNLPFGQQQQAQGQVGAAGGINQAQTQNGVTQSFGFDNQNPLVDNTPFDSGCMKNGEGFWVATLLGMVAYYVMF